MNKKSYHVVVGNGALGRTVARELADRGIEYALCGRSDEGDAHFIKADALNLESLRLVVKDATHIYITIGLPYDHKIWQKEWPVIIQNFITLAKEYDFQLVFFDNVYMYGPPPVYKTMTETHPQQPTSKKGKVRKQITDMLLEAQRKNQIRLVIGRSPVFYGPGVINSALYIRSVENQLKGKKAEFIGNPHTKQSFAYLPDVARGLVRLALDDSAYGEVWHLPTNHATYTTAEFFALTGEKLHAPKDVVVMPRIFQRILGLFVPLVREAVEVAYFTEVDCEFSCEKFMKKYPDFKITSYEDSIDATLASYQKIASKTTQSLQVA